MREWSNAIKIMAISRSSPTNYFVYGNQLIFPGWIFMIPQHAFVLQIHALRHMVMVKIHQGGEESGWGGGYTVGG